MRQRDQTAEDRLDRVLELQALLADVSHKIGPALELGPVLSTVLEAMRSLVDFRGGSICLVDDRGVYVAAADQEITPEMAAARVPVGTGLAGRCVEAGEPIYSADLDQDPRVDPALRRLGTNLPTKSYLGVPLVCLGEVIGLLQVDSIERDAFDEEDLQLLQGLATQVAGAIESARRSEQIRELERMKADFLARVSHELRTPLTIISGFAQTLVNHDVDIDDAQRHQMLQRIQGASHRLEGLIDELLTVNRFEVAEPKPEDVDAGALLDDVLRRAVDPQRVTVTATASDGRDIVLFTDPRVLGHALALLVDNALKYAGHAELAAADGVVSVSDRGPGIPAELRARVFDRFTRGDHTSPGMGLGLAIAKSLVESLGGDLVLADTEVGTRFEVRLP